VGDVIALKAIKKDKTYFKNIVETLKNKKDVPHWFELDVEKMVGQGSRPPHIVKMSASTSMLRW
jgi:hypothetical protein